MAFNPISLALSGSSLSSRWEISQTMPRLPRWPWLTARKGKSRRPWPHLPKSSDSLQEEYVNKGKGTLIYQCGYYVPTLVILFYHGISWCKVSLCLTLADSS